MIAATTESLGDLAAKLRTKIHRYVSLGLLGCGGISLWLYMTDRLGSVAFLIVATGSLAPLLVWARQRKPGLPLAGLMGMQTLAIYGVPLVAQNPDILQFSSEEVVRASLEVGLFGVAIAGGWLFATQGGGRRRSRTYWRFAMLRDANPERTARLAPALLGLGVLFHLANILGLLGVLPSGLFPVARTLADAASVGGGVLGGYFIGHRILKASGAVIFWLLLTFHCLLTAANYTLFPSVSLLISVFVGMFVGGGRLPIVVSTIIVSAFAFFNLSKFEMRARYWEPGAAYARQSLSDLPGRYQEWYHLSYDMLTQPKDEFAGGRGGHVEQKLSNRINNLINLLIAQDAVEHRGIEPLHGETYAIIPALLIPRLFWPEKPRTHEGMVLLNVHFGRQTRAESLVTYISWGLLPEAYGNFGPYFGALICGAVLGYAMGWLEHWARPFPLTSLEALVFFLLVVQFGTSFELVASVWLTSIFQMLVAVAAGTYLFVEKVPLPSPQS
jgi:hypothetical protein